MIKMLFCAIDEEKPRVSGALSFYCRKYEEKRSPLETLSLVIFCCKLWTFVNVQGNNM